MYECPQCQAKHPIKDMLRWPVNSIVDTYIKELASNMKSSIKETESSVDNHSNAYGDSSSDDRTICDRCEKAKPANICYDCGGEGSYLCTGCTDLIHACGIFKNHKMLTIEQKKQGLSVGGTGDYFEDDIRTTNMNVFMCREHANAEYDKFCGTCL